MNLTPFFVDTSAWFAIVDPNDLNHEVARQFVLAKSPLVTTNFIIDETITLVLVKLGYEQALKLGDRLWSGAWARIIRVSQADEQAAWELFRRYQDKAFSFTDCTSFAVMERLGLTHAFAFDEHFTQVGLFLRLP